MKWIEASVCYAAEDLRLAEDLIAHAFDRAGIPGVAMTVNEDPAEGWAREFLPRPAPEYRVTGYVADNEFAEETLQKLGEALGTLRLQGIEARLSSRLLDEEDWAESWKEFFYPEKLGERIVVKPSWRTYDAQPGDIIIELDPGMAFGTGTHATTRLCVRLIEAFFESGKTFLDVGTGSGILMVAAHKLGASLVCGVDIDPVAVTVAGENLARNRVPEEAFRVSIGDLTLAVSDRFDLVAANILSEVILVLLDDIPKVLKPGGIFIASGIIEENAPGVLSKMADLGFTVLEVRYLDGWTAIAARR